MPKPKLLLIAYRAYGDFIYSSPVLPYLFDKYDVYLETNCKGDDLFHDDPRFKQKAVFVFEQYPANEFSSRCEERFKLIRKQINPDVEINLNGTLEVACIARREQPEYHYPVGDRRVVFGSNAFYDAVFRRCGMETPNPLNLEGLYFPEEIATWAKQWREKHAGKFIVFVPIHGSSIHKVFRNWRNVVQRILDQYDDAFVYLIGDNKEKVSDFKHERVRGLFHPDLPFKQTVLMTKYADLVIGPETGIMVAAGMWGTPKIMVTSASSVWQVAQYTRNDFSFQAPVACSPCHLSVFDINDCQNVIEYKAERIPACVKEFSEEMILERTSFVYRNLRRGIPQKVS